SIFIASKINKVSPSFTLSPSDIFNWSTLPGIGATTSSPATAAVGALERAGLFETLAGFGFIGSSFTFVITG
ncbi:unnamed protein product, partial [marine sediment metagenome]